MSGGKALVTTGVALGLLVYMMPDSKATFNVPVSVTPSRSLHALVETPPLEPELPPPLEPSRPRGRPSKPVPPSEAAASLLPEGCGADGECTVDALVRKYAVDNTVVVTFGNDKQRHSTVKVPRSAVPEVGSHASSGSGLSSDLLGAQAAGPVHWAPSHSRRSSS